MGAIHLDATNAARTFRVFGTRGWRATQAKALASLLPEGNLVLGADLNTWLGPGEPASQFFRRLFAETPATLEGSAGRSRPLDYLFFRRTESATARYQVVSKKYGSDHHPLIGWLSN